MARQQQGQAASTYNTSTNNATGYGSGASTIGSTLVPFEQSQLLNPTGYSQGDLGAMIANAMGSAGGATSGITGQTNLQAARTRNASGFSGALDDAARARTAASASSSERVAVDNAQLKQQQRSQAATMLGGLYNTDVGAQNNELSTANDATQTGIAAGKSGWLQQLQGLIGTAGGLGTGIGAAKKAFS